MQSKRVFTIIAALVTAAAVIVFIATLARGTLYSSQDEITASSTPQILMGSSTPDRLLIPAIGVDAHVQAVGVGKSGNMAVPTNYTDVGWYRGGTLPGLTGSAVIDGHVNNGFGLDAVFKDVSKLKTGDDIYIVTKAGQKLHFVVQEIDDYPVTQVPLQTLFDRADTSRLNLITCAGDWDSTSLSYDHRIVVYAVLK